MTRHHLHREDGSVLVIAIVLMTVMLGLGLASYSFVDVGQKRAKEQRARETSLNLTEGVLYSQGFALAQTWPGSAAAGATIPTSCSSASVQAYCPDPNTLAAANSSAPASANFRNVDAVANVSWTTHIRDNGGALSDAFVYAQLNAAQTGTNVQTNAAYSCPSPCNWDANGDRKLWVQARSIVGGQVRNVVALLKREQFSEPFPRSGVTAGSLETTNNGNKAIIDSTGSQVVVRCAPAVAPCADYEAGKNQVLPPPISVPSTPSAMTAVQIARFKAAAKSASPPTYFSSCPTGATGFTGTVVFVDLPSSSTSCIDSNSATYNSPTSPGIVIMPRGTLQMKSTFYGIVYMVNEQNASTVVLTMGANAEVIGGVAVDGSGRLDAGQASHDRPSITYDPNAFNALATFGTAGLVQNTWRELPPS